MSNNSAALRAIAKQIEGLKTDPSQAEPWLYDTAGFLLSEAIRLGAFSHVAWAQARRLLDSERYPDTKLRHFKAFEAFMFWLADNWKSVSREIGANAQAVVVHRGRYLLPGCSIDPNYRPTNLAAAAVVVMIEADRLEADAPASTMKDRLSGFIGEVNRYLQLARDYTRAESAGTAEGDQLAKDFCGELFSLERSILAAGQRLAADLTAAGLDATPSLAVVACLARGIDAPKLLEPEWLRIETELRALALAADTPVVLRTKGIDADHPCNDAPPRSIFDRIADRIHRLGLQGLSRQELEKQLRPLQSQLVRACLRAADDGTLPRIVGRPQNENDSAEILQKWVELSGCLHYDHPGEVPSLDETADGKVELVGGGTVYRDTPERIGAWVFHAECAARLLAKLESRPDSHPEVTGKAAKAPATKDGRGRKPSKAAVVAAKIVARHEDGLEYKDLTKRYQSELEPGTTPDNLGRAIRRAKANHEANRHNSAE